MKLFKGMFATDEADINTQSDETTIVRQYVNYQQHGVIQAGKVESSSNALYPCLQSVCIHVKKKIEHDAKIQNERKIPILQNISDLEAQNQVIDTKLRSENDKLKYEESKIEATIKEINKIKEHMQEITGDSFVKASFWIGLIIIGFLTIYLFVFYSSAAYSAFFKNFTPDDTNIINSIFDAQAFTKAMNDGVAELILLLTIPSVFLGLGFLIHKFQEQKGWSKYFKIAGLVFTTLIFDFIIAYEIVKKIYDIRQQGSFVEMENMNIPMALAQINFWLIIFAGFVVYLIWGFVFDFVMKEYEKLDRVRYAIKTREKQIAEYKLECKNIKVEIQRLETEKNMIIGKINKLKIQLNGVIVFFDDVKEAINDFFTGWINYMKGAGKGHAEINECTAIRNEFLNTLQAYNQYQSLDNNK
jgi:cell division protein FtsB